MQTWGSHGDIRPMLALAEGLRGAGHEVRLVITCVDSAAYAELPSSPGLAISVVASPVIALADEESIGRTLLGIRSPMAQVGALLRLCFDPAEEAMFQAAKEMATWADVVIGHHLVFPLRAAAERAGKPYVSVLLSHAAVPSIYSHPLTSARLPPLANRVLWGLTRAAINRAILDYPNRLHKRLNIPPVRDVVGESWLSSYLTLAAVSPQICARQPDWPASVQVCGFLDMPNIGLEGELPAALSAFLKAGPTPVYITFGSWMPKSIGPQRETLSALAEAVRRAGCRAIIQAPGWRECGFEPDVQILYVNAAPHHRIFPLCRAIVHHGGAGTTQAALLAGKPSVVVAHIGEQEHWGGELRRLGVGVRPLQRRSVTAKGLAARIRQVLAVPEMVARAEALAAAMRDENGVACAVRLIGQAAAGAAPSGVGQQPAAADHQ